MSNFVITLSNVAVMILYMMVGFFLKKIKKSTVEDIPSLSRVLIFGLSFPMILSCFLKLDFSWSVVLKMLVFFIISFVVHFVFLALLILIIGKNGRKDIGKRLICAGGVFGNVGFFGLPIIQAVFPNEPIAACYVSMSVVSMNILLFSFGEYAVCGEKKYISLKAAFLNPTLISFYISAIFFVFNLKNYLPDVVKNSVSLLGSMTAPISMIILGIRLASASFKNIICDKKAWVTCLIKLVAFPLFTFLVMYFLPLDSVFKTCMLILTAAPGATFLLSFAELHNGGQQTAANALLLTSVLCVITIPLFTLLV